MIPIPAQNYIVSHRWTALFLIFLFIGSFYIRLGYIHNTIIFNSLRADAKLYTVIGHNLAAYGVFSEEDGGRDVKSSPSNRSPGYPFFLAAVFKIFGDNMERFFVTILLIQSILGALTVILSYWISRYFLPPIGSGIVALLTMLSPHLISLTNYILTETLFIFLVYTAILLYLIAVNKNKTGLLAISGLFFGYAMCVRTVLVLFPLILAGLTFYSYRECRKTAGIYALILVSTSFVFFLPWTIWSHFAFKDSQRPPSLIAELFYEGSYPGVIYTGVPADQLEYGIGMVHRDDPNFSTVIAEGYPGIFREIGKRFTADPIGYAGWWLIGKPAMFWRWRFFHSADINEYPTLYTWYDRSTIIGATKKCIQALHPAIMFLMHAGAILFIYNRKKNSPSQRQANAAILMFILYFLIIHVVLVPSPRYSLPLRPLAYILAAYAIVEFSMKFAYLMKINKDSTKLEQNSQPPATT